MASFPLQEECRNSLHIARVFWQCRDGFAIESCGVGSGIKQTLEYRAFLNQFSQLSRFAKQIWRDRRGYYLQRVEPNFNFPFDTGGDVRRGGKLLRTQLGLHVHAQNTAGEQAQ